jgi:hypothetical protein
MWYRLGKLILQFRLILLIALGIATIGMGYYALQAKMSYDFSRAVPIDNVKYIEYQAFLKKFGGDGNLLVIGIETDKFYTPSIFNAVGQLHNYLKKVDGV